MSDVSSTAVGGACCAYAYARERMYLLESALRAKRQECAILGARINVAEVEANRAWAEWQRLLEVNRD